MERIGYFNGEIGNLDDMKIPLCDRSVFYGDAVYDAVLVLDKKPFALGLHLDRLYRSCEMTEIAFTVTRDKLEGEIAGLLEYAPMGVSMLYIQVTRGAAPRKHEYPKSVVPNLIMFVSPIALPPKDKRASLASIEDLRFQYCNIKTTNLMPNVFAAQRAASMGATEALLHRGDRVTEAAHSSILMLKDKKLILPPLDELILPGITRAIVESLCKDHSVEVETRIFTVDELRDADEILLCSTTKNVICVYDIDGEAVGGKDPQLALNIQSWFDEEIYRDTGVML
ncbi:MAG: aminotransferase class IV [Clostridia bacterium]|nr:aminotransferase class IV [Clostridia bacterium]